MGRGHAFENQTFESGMQSSFAKVGLVNEVGLGLQLLVRNDLTLRRGLLPLALEEAHTSSAKRLYGKMLRILLVASQTGFNFHGAWRFKLLLHLAVRPMTPTELASIEKKHLSQVSRTLGELRREGLVEYAYTGSRERYYKPTKDGYLAYAMISRQVG